MNRIIALQSELQTFVPRSKRLSKTSSRYSLAKNPAGLFGIAGLTAVEAASLGLDSAALLQPVLTKSGSLSITSDKSQRLLTPQARQKLGNIKKKTYTYPVLWINAKRPLVNNADALIEVTWEGNDYGEIGAAYVRRNLDDTTAFTKTSLNVSFTKLDRIPPASMKDPREWPVVLPMMVPMIPLGTDSLSFRENLRSMLSEVSNSTGTK